MDDIFRYAEPLVPAPTSTAVAAPKPAIPLPPASLSVPRELAARGIKSVKGIDLPKVPVEQPPVKDLGSFPQTPSLKRIKELHGMGFQVRPLEWSGHGNGGIIARAGSSTFEIQPDGAGNYEVFFYEGHRRPEKALTHLQTIEEAKEFVQARALKRIEEAVSRNHDTDYMGHTDFARRPADMFAYASPVPAPAPTTTAKTKRPGAAMKPILPTLGKPAKLPSPIPPDTKVMSEPHPEGKARPVVPKALRAGNPDTLQQRIPRPPKPRYKLQVPMEEAYNRAHDEILREKNSVTHPEDKERYQEAIDDLEKVFVSGSERLMTRFLEDHVGWKTFNHLVQSLKDQEPGLTSRKGLFARAAEDMFAYAGSSPLMAGVESIPPTVKAGVKPPKPELAPTVKGPAHVVAAPKIPLRKMGLHPIPEQKVDPWWHEMPHTNWLRHGEEVQREPLGKIGGINSGWKIRLAGDTPMSDYHAIWKARDDDQTAIARPHTVPEGNPHGHEAAAWEIAHLVGIGGMVPPTVSRENRGQVGSAQHWVPGQDRAVKSPFPFGKPGNSQLPLAAAFDALTMNTDRHMGNWLVDPESSQLTLIDHGLLFPHTHKKPLRGTGEILGNAMATGIPVPAEVVKWQDQWPHIERAMKRNGLTDDQIGLTQSRLASLADAAKNGESFAHWLKRSGIGTNYELK